MAYRGGQPRAIETALELLDTFDAYRKHCHDNPVPIEKTQLFEGEVQRWTEHKRKPLSVQGFSQWCGVTTKTFYSWRKLEDEEYAYTAQLILDAVHEDRFEGGLVGQYHAMLVARSMGLTEKIEQEVLNSSHDKVEIEIRPMGDVPMLVHPDEDPENPTGLTFTQAQLDAGVTLP